MSSLFSLTPPKPPHFFFHRSSSPPPMALSSAASDHHQLPTPTLDSESPTLLHTVSEHGGYAYVSMASRAAAGDVRAAEAAREMAWEQLHSGPWHSVLPVWRDAYAMACLHVAKLHFAAGEFTEALRALDMGLLMGGPFFKSDLHAAVTKVSAKSRAAAAARVSGENGTDLDRRLVRDDVKTTEMIKVLPPKSLCGKVVVRKSNLSLEGFLRDHFLPGAPVILTDCMAHWPAKTKWNDMDYLVRVAGDRTVLVEVGKNYLYPEWKQELIMFSQFLERIKGNDASSGAPTYLAQHSLFDQINELREDICIPDYCCAGGGELRSLNAWFGPAGTVTPLHHDPHHNVFAQVVGKKYIRLYRASLSEELYPHTETMLCNSSQVDLDNIDEKEFPEVQNLEFLDCILEEGDMLYIPPKWWHYVRALTTSMSVSFWWSEYDSTAMS